MRLREGPVQLAARLGIAPSTVHCILTAARLNRVGAKNSATLCDLRVFVDQPTEMVTSYDLDIALDRLGKGS